MDYLQPLLYHFKPKKGWINDPNGLVWFDGYYHVFYQHCPDYEVSGKQPMYWGHARTRDFLEWEELPLALCPDRDYDNGGCWSGTALVKDGRLYLYYASIHTPEGTKELIQSVSVAYSDDGIHFEKYEKNPVIDGFPPEGGPDFRDPAICEIGGVYYCVMATGNPESRTARLLLYQSEDLLHWRYLGIMSEWAEGKYAECPSILPFEDGIMLSASVCPLELRHYFSVMIGSLDEGVFHEKTSAQVDKGPDQYAGQIMLDPTGRVILISWIPGWKYRGYAARDVGCMSCPKELTWKGGTLTAYPVAELRHLLKEEDPALRRTEQGFLIEREGRAPVVYEGEIRDLKILRDGYVLEVFVNGGEAVYTALL